MNLHKHTPLRSTIILAALVVLLLTAPGALAERSFTPRFSVSAPGNITMASNTLMTCDPAPGTLVGGKNCAAAQSDLSTGSGTAFPLLNNNNWTAKEIDIDGDPSTANSSSAKLSLPAGATVLFAGLYWVASAPTGLTSATAKAAQFKGPGRAYEPITATVYDPAPSVDYGYGAFLDVTDQVQSMGAGTYTLGGIATRPGGKNVGAGWSLVVAFQAPGEPLRDLTVFDGNRTVGGNGLIDIPVTGFKTPATGTVQSDVGLVAFEGDRGVKGDYAQVDSTVLTDAASPDLNFFNSWISAYGTRTSGRVPSNGNALGFDAKIVAANGVLANGASSAVIRAKTSGEGYQPIVTTFSTELYAPNLQVTKTVRDMNGGEVRLGNELEYTLTVKNIGGDGAVASELLEKSMPDGTEFVPGSVTYDGSGISDLTDADRGEASGGTGPVVVRFGSGATDRIGGLIAPGESHTLKFRVKVTSVPPGGGIISNVASIDYAAQTLGTPVSANSPRADIRVDMPDLSIAKTISSSHFANGIAASYRIAVKNIGTASSEGLTEVTDHLPAAFQTSPTVSGTGWTCDPIVAGLVHCSRSDQIAAGASFPNLTVSVPSLDNPANATVSNTASVSGDLDSDPTNNESTASQVVGVGQSVIPVSVTSDRPDVLPGEVVGVSADFTNNGPSTATDPSLVMEAIPPNEEVRATGFSVISTDGTVTKADCTLTQNAGQPAKVTCLPGTLAKGVSVTITINFKPDVATALASFDVKGTSSASNYAAGPATSTDTVNIIPVADLQVVKTSDVSTVEAPNQVKFTIETTNNGPTGSGLVNVKDDLPLGLTLVSATWADDNGGSGTCGSTGRSVECRGVGPIAPSGGPGATKVTVQVTATADGGAHGVRENTAMAVGQTRDVLLDNNTATAAVTILPWADLDLTKTGPTSMKPGGTGSFRLTVTNRGPSAATSTTVVDTLPRGMTAGTPLPAGCAASGRKVTCDAGDLNRDDVRTFDIPVKVSKTIAPGTRLNNVAAASSPVPGKDATAEDSVPIVVAAPSGYGLSARIFGPSYSVQVGSVARLWVKVSSGRSSMAKNTTACATLPGNVTYLSSKGAWNGRRVCWKVGTIKAGDHRWMSITVLAANVGQRTASVAAKASNLPRVTDETIVRTHFPFTG